MTIEYYEVYFLASDSSTFMLMVQPAGKNTDLGN